MPAKIRELASKRLAHPPTFLPDSMQYEVYMGSDAYGCSSGSSDIDIYGFCIPDKNIIFPHLTGYIEGFDEKPQGFGTYTQHHIVDQSARGGKGAEYDYSIHSIIKFFSLVMENNPNMVDSLFVPLRCILFTTPIGQEVRDNRHMFLHKGSFHKFRGYAFAQLHKLRIKKPSEESNRKEIIDKYGYDVKFAYHIVRLLNECESILVLGDLDLEESKEQLKSIRNGEWKLEEIEDYFKRNEPRLQELYDKSKLPYGPPVEKIKRLLLHCLEQHFGTIEDCIKTIDPAIKVIKEIEEVLYKYHENSVI